MPVQRKKLHTDRPDFTAALRTAAWQAQLTGKDFTPAEIQTLVQRERNALGLKSLQGGAPSDQLQRRTKGTALYQKHDRPAHYEIVGGRLRPTPKVNDNWRFLSTPSHAEIRLVAREGHLQCDGLSTFTTRGSHLPSLTLPGSSCTGVVTCRVCELVTSHFNPTRPTREFSALGHGHFWSAAAA
ncbi:hypothetical protein ACFOPQ_20725 [Deinococcus antarcticus]|uniref:Uncharacterized protein n=1 Tax=Deinococcus antarcticus TaxID=1298767 RepID=A0ABV8AD71_9DEIO